MSNIDLQQTLVLVKPDAVQRRLVGEIVARFERKGLCLTAMKLLRMDRDLAGRLYAVHQGKPFYEPLVAFATSAPVVALVIAGRDCISVVRQMIGATDGREAAPGTVRGDFGLSPRHNLVHASDSPASAAAEIGLLFEDREILATRPQADAEWVVEPPKYAAW